MSNAGHAFRVGSLVGALRLFGMAAKFALLLFIGQHMNTEALGVYGLFAATSVWLISLVGLEYHNYAIRSLLQSPNHERGAVVRGQLGMFVYGWLLSPIALAPLFLASGMPNYCLWFLAIIAPASHLALESQRLLTALGRPVAAYLINGLSNGSWVFAWIGAAVIWPRYTTLPALFTSWSCASLIAATLGAKLVIKNGIRGRLGGRMAPNLHGLRAGLLYVVSALCFLGIDTIDRYAIQVSRTAEEVGIYTFHSGLARAHRDLLFAIAIAPVLPGLIAPSSARPPSSTRLAFINLALAGAITLGVWVALALTRRPELEAGVPVFYWAIFGNVVLGASTHVHYRMYAAGRDKHIAQIHAAGLVIAATASIILVPSFGATGAAAANCAALCCIAALRYHRAKPIPGTSDVRQGERL